MAIIKVLSYNTQGDMCNVLARHFAEMPEFREADIVALQEVPFEKLVSSISEMTGFSNTCFLRSVNTRTGRPSFSAVLVNKYNTAMRASGVNVKLKPFEGVDVLKSALGFGHKSGETQAMVSFLDIGGEKTVKFGNIHLDVYGGTEHRREQLASFLDEFSSIQARHNGVEGNQAGKTAEIICGDFNTMSLFYGPFNALFARRNTCKIMREAERRGFVNCTNHVLWTQDIFASRDEQQSLNRVSTTCKAFGLSWHQKLDHILVRGVKRIIECGVITASGHRHLPGSDHIPIYAKIEI